MVVFVADLMVVERRNYSLVCDKVKIFHHCSGVSPPDRPSIHSCSDRSRRLARPSGRLPPAIRPIDQPDGQTGTEGRTVGRTDGRAGGRATV